MMRKEDLPGWTVTRKTRTTPRPWTLVRMQVVSMRTGARRMTTMWRHGGLHPELV